MNLVDEEHIALVEIANDCCNIARPFYRRSKVTRRLTPSSRAMI